jgi:hypothetical protein
LRAVVRPADATVVVNVTGAIVAALKTVEAGRDHVGAGL